MPSKHIQICEMPNSIDSSKTNNPQKHMKISPQNYNYYASAIKALTPPTTTTTIIFKSNMHQQPKTFFTSRREREAHHVDSTITAITQNYPFNMSTEQLESRIIAHTLAVKSTFCFTKYRVIAQKSTTRRRHHGLFFWVTIFFYISLV